MNIKEFQKKLGDVLTLAKSRGGRISAEEIRTFFASEELAEEQLEKVYEYLNVQKIEVCGREDVRTAETGPEINEEKPEETWEAEPLTPEDEQYLKRYRKTLEELPQQTEDIASLLEKAIGKDMQALQAVTEYFMPQVVETALSLYRRQVPLADTIAEGNVHLWMAVNRLTSAEHAEELIRKGISDGIAFMIEEQTEQKRRDDSMVNKVSKLETAIEELTDGDDKVEFSVDELSAFLDMPREEIEDILRLTGSEENK